MRKACLAIVFLALALFAGSAEARAQCANATIPGCQPAVNPQATDVLLLYQYGQTPHPRKITIQQLSNTTAGTFTNLSVTGNATIAGTLGVTGATTLSSLAATNATLSGTIAVTGNAVFSGPLSAGTTNVTGLTVTGAASASSLTTSGAATIGTTLNVTGLTTLGAPLKLPPYTIANLPSVPAQGELAWATDCRRNTQGAGLGTGCVYFSDTTGTWQRGDISNLTITIGSATPIILGGTIPGSGTGANVQMTTAASKVNGDCVQFDATGNTLDAGAPCGGGGGSGSVAAAAQFSLAYYASAGSTNAVAGLAPVANTVPSYGPSGILSLSTTLPGSLTIPSPAISNPTISGTANVSTISMTGKITTAASVVGGANFSLLPGTAPSAPVNGDMWMTTAGVQARVNGVTTPPFIGLTNLSATGVLGYNNTTGVISCATCATTTSGGALSATTPLVLSVAGLFTCPTCATTTNGGILSATGPMTISAAGVIALGQTQHSATLPWDANTNVTNNTYPLALAAPFIGGGNIQSVVVRTAAGSFNAAVKVAGTTLCTVAVSTSSTLTPTACAGAFASGNEIDVVTSGVSTSPPPSNAAVQVNYTNAAL